MTVSYVLGGAALDAAFPFHFVVAADDAGGRDSDGALVIRQVGSRLAALGAQLAVGARLDACFRLDPALVSQTLAAVGALAGRAVLLECLDRPARLRGQFVSLGDGTALAFLGSPWVSEAAELRMLGLAIEDFPVHDAVVDRLRAFLDEAGGAARLTATSLRRAVELVTHLKQTTVDQALPQPRRLNVARHVTEVLAGLAPVLRQVTLRSTVNEDFADGGLPADTRLLPKPLSPDKLIDAVAAELGHI